MSKCSWVTFGEVWATVTAAVPGPCTAAGAGGSGSIVVEVQLIIIKCIILVFVTGVEVVILEVLIQEVYM